MKRGVNFLYKQIRGKKMPALTAHTRKMRKRNDLDISNNKKIKVHLKKYCRRKQNRLAPQTSIYHAFESI